MLSSHSIVNNSGTDKTYIAKHVEKHSRVSGEEIPYQVSITGIQNDEQDLITSEQKRLELCYLVVRFYNTNDLGEEVLLQTQYVKKMKIDFHKTNY